MYVQDHDLTWEQFEQKFRKPFEREITPDERRWFHAIWEIARSNDQGKSKSAAV